MIAIEPESAAPPPASLKLIGVQRVPFHFGLGELRLFSPTVPLVVLELEPGAALPADWRAAAGDFAAADGCLLKGLQSPVGTLVPADSDWLQIEWRTYPRYLVDLSIGYNAYMAKFSAKTRSTLKRKMRKFADLSGGEIGVLEFRTKDELTRFFPLARSVSAKTYQERLLGAGLPDTPAFAEYAASLAENGALRAYVLDLQGRPAAYLFLPIEHGRVVYAYLGYDPAVAQHSPGTVLQLAVMERLFAEPGLRLFDFTEGAGEHKELFSTHALPCVDVLLLKRGSRGVRVVRAHAAYSALEQRTVALADRLGLKARIKRLVRRLSAPAA